MFLADGRLIVQIFKGKFYDEHCRSEFYLLEPDNRTTRILEADGFFCNHVQPCPTDPDLFAYDRWPSPKRPTEVIIHIRNVDGSIHQPLPQLPGTPAPGPIWGAQRDHYLWTSDGNRILSDLNPMDSKSADHFEFEWWVSATDWRTGEDWSVKYPRGRWGCNFATTPDSKWIVSAGGPGFEKIYAIEIERLREGWNERVLCTMPPTEYSRLGGGPFSMPHVLPDQSGVIYTAGWFKEWGVYMVEWPR
jgi:hypothetical protein